MALIKKQDYINSFKLIKGDDGDITIQEKEAKGIIHDLIKNEVSEFFRYSVKNYEEELKQNLTKTFNNIEGRMVAFIEAKTTKMCENICDSIITRKFNEEVEKKAKELLLKRGKF